MRYLAVFLISLSAIAAPAFVRRVENYSYEGSSISVDITPASGNALVSICWVTSSGKGPFAISDNLGGTWSATNGGSNNFVFATMSGASSSTRTVTCTATSNATASYLQVTVYEISGANAFDVTLDSTSQSDPWTVSFNVSASESLAVGFAINYTSAFTGGNGDYWTPTILSSSLNSQYRAFTSSGSKTCPVPLASSPSTAYGGVVVAYQQTVTATPRRAIIIH